MSDKTDYDKWMLENYNQFNKDTDIFLLKDYTGGTVILRNLPGGDSIIIGKVNNEESAKPYLLASKGIMPKFEVLSDPLIEPDKNDSLNAWFNYFHKCKNQRKKFTLKDLARKTGKKYGLVRKEHSKYLKENKKGTI
jgi:hypothetical protein